MGTLLQLLSWKALIWISSLIFPQNCGLGSWEYVCCLYDLHNSRVALLGPYHFTANSRLPSLLSILLSFLKGRQRSKLLPCPFRSILCLIVYLAINFCITYKRATSSPETPHTAVWKAALLRKCRYCPGLVFPPMQWSWPPTLSQDLSSQYSHDRRSI